ncbi:MAG: site-specific DNA-methyltransferase [Deltaproteobacteria bacterium]
MADNSLKKGRYTKYGNKIGLYSNAKGSFIKNGSEVVLNFPFKDTVLEAGMSREDAGREERFLHLEIDSKDIDTLEEPKALTDFRYIDKDGEKPLNAGSGIEFFDNDGNLKQNLLIKGNNLLALYSLREKLAGKVKLIYIDPPYNTGNDGFRYNDNFNHSAWLTFMKNRLEVAKDLLADEGSIWISIDDNESHYLKILCDEIFGRDNFVIQSVIKRGSATGHKSINPTPIQVCDYLLVFTKDKSKWKYKPVYQERGFDRAYSKFIDNFDDNFENWTFISLKQAQIKFGFSIEKNLEKYADRITRFAQPDYKNVGQDIRSLIDISKKDISKVYLHKRDGYPDIYMYAGDRILFYKDKLRNVDGRLITAEPATNLWVDMNYQGIASEGGVTLLRGKKPELQIKRILEMSTNENDIVLDFMLGSGTTSAVAHKMNRRWVGIEQMDYIEDVAKERLKKVVAGEQGGISKSVDWTGGGSFVYFELKKYNQEYVDRIMAAASLSELEDLYVDMRNNAFLKFWFDRKEFEKDENFRKLDIEKRKQKLVEVLDENQLYLNYADMGDTRHKVSDDEKTLTDKFYGTADK